MIWTALATLTFAASAVATSVTAAYLRCWLRPPRVSSIQWLFSVFFANLAVWTSGRFIYFVWFWSVASDDHTNDNIDDTKFNQFDRLGLQAVEWLRSHGTPMMSLVMCIGDTALFGVAICTFPIARELWLLVRNAMDAGAAKETLKVHTYRIIIHGLVAVFGFVEGSIAIVDGGYSHQTHGMKLFAYATQLTSLLFIAGSLMDLKCSGRKFEAVHGVFVQSPLYARLKRMMLVYAFGTCQFQLSSFILNFVSGTSDFLSTYSGISLVLYSMTGLALSITIGCSQTCVLDMCACMMPSNGENPIASARGELLDDDDYQTGIKPPEQPVFVYTDIESSSELWSKDGGRIMQQATDLHDNIMRTALNKFHGYEITTVGDSFQLAFATIAEAVNYCLHVQNVLLAAPWPKELHGLVPATEKVRNGHRLVFCGLRVRMGIHDTWPMKLSTWETAAKFWSLNALLNGFAKIQIVSIVGVMSISSGSTIFLSSTPG
ncbi:TPA: hypothetical protein N0F65_009510 [Lagenidium giganteum]|uniref:Guanylate cyclase domain-containing protein n=1 Tax=Lagenidium giganteum TaxID=4803 RepID=A0AAV2ZEA8_9STRA|nr:TPA: hypothetical protein N0F65_009510 [Lagenidium giganteum]